MHAVLLFVALMGNGGGSARPPEAASLIEILHAQDEVVQRVGYRLATANSDLCAAPKPGPGFLIETLEQYAPVYRSAAAKLLKLGRFPTVTNVVRGSPADVAGLRAGDALTAMNALPLPTSPSHPHGADFTRTENVQKMLLEEFARGRVTLSLLRDEQALAVEVTAPLVCAADYNVVTENALNSETDGSSIQISSRLVALAVSDDDIAAVLAHELAHNVLRHRAQLDKLHVSRGLLGQLGRSAALIRQTEYEADRLSIYLLARAGYSLDAAMSFWRRLRVASLTVGDRTHPQWSERLSAMQTEVDLVGAVDPKSSKIDLPSDLDRLIRRETDPKP